MDIAPIYILEPLKGSACFFKSYYFINKLSSLNKNRSAYFLLSHNSFPVLDSSSLLVLERDLLLIGQKSFYGCNLLKRTFKLQNLLFLLNMIFIKLFYRLFTILLL
jgi:hypothetical protein